MNTAGRWLKQVIGSTLRLYTFPLRWNERVGYFVKGSCFPEGSEHLYRSVRHILANGRVPGDATIVDVGAAGGGTAAYLRARFPANPIIMFEPNPRMADRLTTRAGQIGGTSVRRVALGAERRSVVLNVTANDLSSSLNPLDPGECEQLPPSQREKFRVNLTVPVDVSTLDEELGSVRDVLLLKLDTQGTELDVLRGGLETLRHTRYVLSEMNNHSLYQPTCQYYEVDEYLRLHGFRLADVIVSYYPSCGIQEYDALYENAVHRGDAP